MQVKLNDAQKKAVETIDGPLLVLAGPGTGKTQLLSARVAEILKRTDVNAHNILCLTFTESGAHNMRERLRSMIGDAAYDVHVSTYHAFGADIIKSYSEYFQTIGLERSDDIRMERPIDDLTQIQVVESIISKLPFDSPLLSARYYIKSVVSTISDLKQHEFTPESLRAFAEENLQAIDDAQSIIDDIVNDKGGISRKKDEKLSQYAQLLERLGELDSSLARQATEELALAHEKADEFGSPTPLREWKDDWLHKDEQDTFTLTDRSRSVKLLALSDVFAKYQSALQEQGAYDFDDMILRANYGLQNNDELRYNVQEKYQYILLDEFQDTNPAQFALVKTIADHPVHEGRPNIMAVGDDDQAIFAFQGANVGNMDEFLHAFLDVEVINLTENFRSHSDILHVAHNIAGQIEDRLHHRIDNIKKTLVAKAKDLPKSSSIERHEFSASASEYAWVAEKIASLIESGESPEQIAVLAPKHAILEDLVPFLKRHDTPMHYEKREDILQTIIVQGLRMSAELVIALQSQQHASVNELMPRVLSLPHWGIKPADIWRINWRLDAERFTDTNRSWAEIALSDKACQSAVEFFLELSQISDTQPLEITLDMLSGVVELPSGVHSPLKDFYVSSKKREQNPLAYYEAVSHLSVIRSKLRDHQSAQDKQLTLQDFVDLFVMYESAESPLINSHPVASNENAVQLMTAYKAKGLEFAHVFILQAHDDVWGSKSRGGNNKLSLPPNLQHIRYVGGSEDERRRLFFVALTRAKHGLYITSHAQKDSGKATEPLKYLGESDGVSHHLPEHAREIKHSEQDAETVSRDIETLWSAPHTHIDADFRALLADRLASYKMSPTHLNSFIDLEHGGPETFLLNTLLRFPQAPSASGEYGTAVHNTLEWYQNELNSDKNPSIDEVVKRYDYELSRRYMSEADREHARDKGRSHLRYYLSARADMFQRPAKAEVNFFNEGVTLGDARLSGKIDRLEIDEQNRTVRIVDYKTGKPLSKWGSDMKSLKYRQQLYFYKFLIENSNTYKGFKIEEARLEFIEADAKGNITDALTVDFNDREEQETKNLIEAIWNLIQKLDLPDVSGYKDSVSGSKDFVKELLAN